MPPEIEKPVSRGGITQFGACYSCDGTTEEFRRCPVSHISISALSTNQSDRLKCTIYALKGSGGRYVGTADRNGKEAPDGSGISGRIGGSGTTAGRSPKVSQ